MNLTLEEKEIKVPRQLWIHLLGYLDGESLRKTLLLNKKSYQYGCDKRLWKISKRESIDFANRVDRMTPVQKVDLILEKKDVHLFAESTGKKGLDTIVGYFLLILWGIKLLWISGFLFFDNFSFLGSTLILSRHFISFSCQGTKYSL